jgi:hypothetical protein
LWLSIGGRVGHSSLHALDIHEGSRADPGGRRWDVEVRAPDEIRSENADRRDQDKAAQVAAQVAAKLDADKRKVINAMAKFSGGETPKVIRGRAGVSGERFNVVISSLLEDGVVVETQLTKPNRTKPYDGYKLAE